MSVSRVKNFLIFAIFLLLPLFFVNAGSPLSESSQTLLWDQVGQQGLNSTGIFEYESMESIIAVVIQSFLSLLGVIFVVLMLLGGYNWMTAQGDESKVEKAKSTIQRAVIGLIIVVSAYSITYTIFKAL